MKRINIHFDGKVIDGLDGVVKKILNTKDYTYWRSKVTRADLIRFAVDEVFGLNTPWIHVSRENLRNYLKKHRIIKK